MFQILSKGWLCRINGARRRAAIVVCVNSGTEVPRYIVVYANSGTEVPRYSLLPTACHLYRNQTVISDSPRLAKAKYGMNFAVAGTVARGFVSR